MFSSAAGQAMNTRHLVMQNRLNLAALREDLKRLDHAELVEIQLDLIETLSLCFDRIRDAAGQEATTQAQEASADQR
jgi:hypothetical protein